MVGHDDLLSAILISFTLSHGIQDVTKTYLNITPGKTFSPWLSQSVSRQIW